MAEEETRADRTSPRPCRGLQTQMARFFLRYPRERLLVGIDTCVNLLHYCQLKFNPPKTPDERFTHSIHFSS
jgi:hypothetical protein